MTEQENKLIHFKTELKEWLKAQNCSIKWLALNLGKSEGTIKNWLYIPSLNITEENQKAISTLQEWHAKSDPRLKTLPTSPPSKGLAVFPLLSYSKASIDWTGEAFISNEIFKTITSWILACSSLNSTSLNDLNHSQCVDIAEWITDTVMEDVRQVIKQKKLEVEDSLGTFDLSDLQGDGKGAIYEPDYYNYSVECFSSTLGLSEGDLIHAAIPVIKEKWYQMYLEIAAKIQGKSTEQFVIDTLNSKSKYLIAENLNDFLAGDSTPLTSEAEGGNDYEDVPF